ncbi:hypothetical protein T261_3994 [Streptomyces lydicus]|nr:hypothetical protein T261_3994 [Streptomyces lydicus]
MPPLGYGRVVVLRLSARTRRYVTPLGCVLARRSRSPGRALAGGGGVFHVKHRAPPES